MEEAPRKALLALAVGGAVDAAVGKAAQLAGHAPRIEDQGTAIEVPQATALPRLQGFQAQHRDPDPARGILTKDVRLRFLMQTGLKAGRELQLEFPIGVKGAALARLLRTTADRIEDLVDLAAREKAELEAGAQGKPDQIGTEAPAQAAPIAPAVRQLIEDESDQARAAAIADASEAAPGDRAA